MAKELNNPEKIINKLVIDFGIKLLLFIPINKINPISLWQKYTKRIIYKYIKQFSKQMPLL